METIAIGKPIPSIRLPDQDKELVDIGDLKGKRVLLSFHPLAWTGACQRQMEALELNVERLKEANAVAFGISVDAPPSKKAWADALGIGKTRLLSDFWPRGAVAESLGLFRERDGFSERAVVLLDTEGVVRFVKVYPIGEAPDVEEQLRELESI